MKKTIYILLLSAAALFSCSKSDFENAEVSATGLNIILKMAGTPTKAVVTMPGDDALNENRINGINYYIFASDADDATVLLSGTKTISENIGAEGKTVNLGLTEEQFASLFPQSTTRLSIYIVANATSILEGKTITTLGSLKSTIMEVEAQGGTQSSFVMTGFSDSLVEGATRNNKRCAEVGVDLGRVLSKVSLKVSLEKEILIPCRDDGTIPEEGEETDLAVRWQSIPNGMRVEFFYLGADCRIDGASSYKGNLFSLDGTSREYSYTDGAAYSCYCDDPYYSCPRAWNVGDEDKPYFMITIPWTCSLVGDTTGKDISWFNDGETKTCYYKVILSNKKFESNNWYIYSVALKGLGSLTPGTVVDLTDLDLTVADWRNSITADSGHNTEAEFQDARVLDIPQAELTLYNQETASIAFTSSHDCEIESVTLTTYDYTKETPAANVVTPTPNPFSIDNGTKTISFSHTLRNDLTAAAFDYQEFEYKVVIRHSDADGHAYRDELVLRQIPALVVAAQTNSAGKNANNRTNYVNNTQDATSGWQYTNSNMNSRYNNNPNMFIISASVFNDGTRIIGDPRSDTPETFSGLAQAQDIKGTTRTLANYYRADPGKSNVIAPKFRVASSWGRVGGSMSYNDAVKRCAAYQEDGYPAGRWRLPTEQEVEFMTTLSSKGYIDVLFEKGNSYYWCNSQRCVNISNDGIVSFVTRSSNSYVRCVYDEWYWENSRYARVGLRTFRWGDMLREEFE